jgi:hypothetical protein
VFKPRFAPNKYDGLPEDAWTGFLAERTSPSVTRDDMRPFLVDEQRSILNVGACLECHDESSKVMDRTLFEWPGILKNLAPECVVPEW